MHIIATMKIISTHHFRLYNIDFKFSHKLLYYNRVCTGIAKIVQDIAKIDLVIYLRAYY